MNGQPGCPPLILLQNLVADAVTAGEQAELAAHLDGCDRCRQTLDQLLTGQAAWSVLAELSDRPAPVIGPADPAEDFSLDFLESTEKDGVLGRLGPYRVVEVIGRGGMGVVLKAFDPTLHRFVAIKVLAPQLATSAAARQRFAREGRAGAAVSHEHVVAIHAVDEAGGLPYLVMQYVPGLSLQQRLDQDGPLELEAILRIGMQTASALAAAHAQGLVHRDVKPANILLENGIERVKITDFGLARATDDGRLTRNGMVAGTPEYMSPEQARGESTGPASDLFSLGSVLYTMCTGMPPFQAESAVAVLRCVSDDEPRPLRKINPAIPLWLAQIIQRLHAKAVTDRFSSAAEVADLLGRHLAHILQPTLAPPPPLPRLSSTPPGRTVWRRSRLLAAVSVLLGGLLLFLFGEAVGLPWWNRPGAHGPESRPAARRTLNGRDGPIYALAFAPGGTPLLAAGTDDGAVKLWDPATGGDLGRLEGHTATVRAVSFTRDGELLASAGDDGAVKVWNVAKRRLCFTLQHGGVVHSVAFAPNGGVLASAGSDKNINLWDAAAGTIRLRIRAHKGTVYAIAFTVDGRTLATGGADGTVKVWDADTGQERTSFQAHALAVRVLRFSPDGGLLATGSWDKTVKVWDVASWRLRETLEGHRHMVLALAFSPDGAMLASASGDRMVRLWDAGSGEEVALLDGHKAGVRAVAFSPDGRTLATGSGDKTVKLWDVGEDGAGR